MVAFVLGVFLFWVALYLYLPTLPVYVQTKTGSLATVGLILGQYGLWLAIARIPVGISADWLGRRKPFILGGLILVGLGAWLLATADSATGLFVGRAVTGVAAATWVPLLVMFTSFYPAREAARATALVTTVASLGRAAAPSVTGFLNELGGYTLAFYLAAGVAVLAFLIFLPQPEKPRPGQRPSLASIGRLFIRRDVLVPALLNAVVHYAVFAIALGFLVIRAKEFGANDVAQSLLVSLHLFMLVAGNVLASALVRHVRPHSLVLVSVVIMAASIAATALGPTLPLLFLAQIVFGLSHGILLPILMGLSIENVAEAERTTAMGLHQSIYAIGMFAGPWLSGMLAKAVGLQTMFLVTSAGVLAAGLILSRFLGRPTASRGW